MLLIAIFTLENILEPVGVANFFKNYWGKKHLIIRGLGMRINYLRVLHKLQLKLGFSNLITVDVPKSVRVLRRKDTLTLEGNNSVIVGNFANLIRSFRYPDSYKGKGFWYKNELRSLKPVKKV